MYSGKRTKVKRGRKGASIDESNKTQEVVESNNRPLSETWHIKKDRNSCYFQQQD